MNNGGKIHVETIGYYHSHSNSTSTPDLLPKQLNSNKQFFEDPNLPIPFINLKIEYPTIMETREQNLSSVLDYLRQKGWPDGEKPDFVTDRYLLKSIVAPEESTKIRVVRIDGICFLVCSDEEPVGNYGFRWVFKHMLTKSDVDEEFETEATIRKAMFKATVEGENKKYTVLYSGKVDAIDDENQHYEIKVAANGTCAYFWETNSYRLSWQLLLGDINSIIVGARTGKHPGDPKTRRPLNYPPFSIYKVDKISQKAFFKKANSYLVKEPSKRQFEDGHKDLRELLELIEKTLTKDGDGFVFSRTIADPKWKIREDENAVQEFRGQILKMIPE